MQTCLDKRVIHQSWAEGQLKAYYPDNSSIPHILNYYTHKQTLFDGFFSLSYTKWKSKVKVKITIFKIQTPCFH